MKKITLFLIFIGLLLITRLYLYQDSDQLIVPEYTEVVDSSSAYEIKAKLISNQPIGKKTVNDFINSYLEDFSEMAESEVSNLNEDGFNHNYTLDIIPDHHLSENYLSYSIIISEYTGGANVNQTVQTFTFNKEEDQVSLLEMGEIEKLTDELQLKLSEMEDDLFPGVAQEISLEDVNSFYVEQEKLVIVFSKYEIAPGAVGLVEVKIDLQKIR